MGMSGPTSKAECDRQIAAAERRLAEQKRQLEECRMYIKKGNLSRGTDSGHKIQIERIKGEIKDLKALRRTLK